MLWPVLKKNISLNLLRNHPKIFIFITSLMGHKETLKHLYVFFFLWNGGFKKYIFIPSKSQLAC